MSVGSKMETKIKDKIFIPIIAYNNLNGGIFSILFTKLANL
jgi:hypothetical protein